jgi:periplasmic protein TonB
MTVKFGVDNYPAKSMQALAYMSRLVFFIVTVSAAAIGIAGAYYSHRPAAAGLSKLDVAPSISAMESEQAQNKATSNFVKAQDAYSRNQLFYPVGDNAFEYFLRDQEVNPNAKIAALELVPLAGDLMLQALNAKDYDEAERLLKLIDHVDPNSSYVARVRERLSAMRQTPVVPTAPAVTQQPIAQSLAATMPVMPASAKDEERFVAGGEANLAAPNTASLLNREQISIASAVSGDTTPKPTAGAQVMTQPKLERKTSIPSTSEIVNTLSESLPISARSSETPARLISSIQANYPMRARQQGLTGWVDLRLTVAANGSVRKAEVVRGNPERVFDIEAVRAAQRLKFVPKKVGDVAVETEVNQRVFFGKSSG